MREGRRIRRKLWVVSGGQESQLLLAQTRMCVRVLYTVTLNWPKPATSLRLLYSHCFPSFVSSSCLFSSHHHLSSPHVISTTCVFFVLLFHFFRVNLGTASYAVHQLLDGLAHVFSRRSSSRDSLLHLSYPPYVTLVFHELISVLILFVSDPISSFLLHLSSFVLLKSLAFSFLLSLSVFPLLFLSFSLIVFIFLTHFPVRRCLQEVPRQWEPLSVPRLWPGWISLAHK